MATIIVETGEIVTGANSYLSTTDLQAYADDRGITITGDKSELLILAMDYIEQQIFKGYKVRFDQPLQWPRYNVYVDGYTISYTTIPDLLKAGLAECAIAIDAGNNPLAEIPREKSSVTVGTISVSYAPSSSPVSIVRTITNKLQKLIDSNNGMSFGVSR
jgi:hypothetical protein